MTKYSRLALTVVILGVLASVGAFMLRDRPSTEQSAYAQQANEICSELEEAERKFDAPGNLPRLANFLEQTAPIAKRARDQLGNLNPAPGSVDAHRALLTRFDEALRLSEAARVAAISGDEDRVREVFRKFNEVARPLNSKIREHGGLEKCLPEKQ